MSKNIVEYVGGPEALEFILKNTLRALFDEYYVNMNRIDHLTGLFQIHHSSEPANGPIPETDLRIPNFYRDQNNERALVLSLRIMLPSLRESAREVCSYRQRTNTLTLFMRHDPLLIKIVEKSMKEFLPDTVIVKESEMFPVEYILPEPRKKSFTDGEIAPDLPLSTMVKIAGEAVMRGNTGSLPRPFNSFLRDWLLAPSKARRDDLEKEAREILHNKQRKMWFAAERIYRPFMQNSRAKHPQLAVETAPKSDDWFVLLKHFSNNYDTPLPVAGKLAIEAMRYQRIANMISQVSTQQQQEIASLLEEEEYIGTPMT